MTKKKWLLILSYVVIGLFLMTSLVGCHQGSVVTEVVKVETLEDTVIQEPTIGTNETFPETVSQQPTITNNGLIERQPDIDSRSFLSEKLLMKGMNESQAIQIDGGTGGIVPHHDVAYQMMADFYTTLADDAVTLVVLIGPNHFGTNDGVLTYNGSFKTFSGVIEPASELITQLVSSQVVSLDYKLIYETEHALNIQMGYIASSFPSAEILPLLIGEENNVALVNHLALSIREVLDTHEGQVMIIGTVDFAHYLDEPTTEAHDLITKQLIVEYDYDHIMKLDDGYVDSPSVLVLTMQLLDAYQMVLLDASNSKAILGYDDYAGLTSYQTYYFE